MGLSLSNHLLLVGVNAMVVSLLLSWYAYGSKLAVTDESNERSLHQGKAVTGAGIFMFLPLCLSVIFVFPDFVTSYLLLLMTLLGFADDKFDLSFKLRLFIQVLLAAVCLIYYGFDTNLWSLFLLIAAIWWINLFNFMDGANGMAGLHGLITLSFYGVVFYQHDALNFIISSGVVIILIYLIFNVVLKKLFMGDSGSLPMAFLLVVLALWSIQSGWLSYWQVAIIHAVFITDATLTLLVRLYRRENITQAHASHLYQRLIKNGATHVKISGCYAVVTSLLCVVAIVIGNLTFVVQLSVLFLIYAILLVIFMKTFSLQR